MYCQLTEALSPLERVLHSLRALSAAGGAVGSGGGAAAIEGVLVWGRHGEEGGWRVMVGGVGVVWERV